MTISGVLHETIEIDYRDDTRTLFKVFNGDFFAPLSKFAIIHRGAVLDIDIG